MYDKNLDIVGNDSSNPYVTSMYVPRQPISFINSIPLNTRLRQVINTLAPTTNIDTSPVNIQQIGVGKGLSQVAVQFLVDPSNPKYQSTSVLLRGNSGATALQTAGNKGPLLFRTSASVLGGGGASVVIQTNTRNATGTSSFGDSNSRTLNNL